MKMASRVEALESRTSDLVHREVHFIVQDAGQSRDDALDAYGREKIGLDDDLVIFRVKGSLEQG